MSEYHSQPRKRLEFRLNQLAWENPHTSKHLHQFYDCWLDLSDEAQDGVALMAEQLRSSLKRTSRSRNQVGITGMCELLVALIKGGHLR
jgi:hypothetical protein